MKYPGMHLYFINVLHTYMKTRFLLFPRLYSDLLLKDLIFLVYRKLCVYIGDCKHDTAKCSSVTVNHFMTKQDKKPGLSLQEISRKYKARLYIYIYISFLVLSNKPLRLKIMRKLLLTQKQIQITLVYSHLVDT